MLTYQDVIAVNLKSLTTTAKDWDDMADGFEELETLYRNQVECVANDSSWVGVSAGAASSQFTATRKQYADAQVEARAVASILRDAHGQFFRLIGHVEDLVEQAKKAEMPINSQGEAVYDYGKLTPNRHDEDYPSLVSQYKKAEAAWTKRIKDAVRAVDDADQGVKLALHDAAGIKSWFERVMDPLHGMEHGFNGDAVGDIEVVEAREAKKYADRILVGERPDDLEEWKRLMRDNSGDPVFSRTFLDSLGPDKTLQLTNKIDDLAYFDEKKNRNDYLSINGGLADSLATATRVPDFKDANGKHILFGTAAYNDAFKGWQKTSDAGFYNKWRDALHERGDDKYDLKAAGENVGFGFKGHDQQVRGYQSLATLMAQGHRDFSPQFVADVTDDMISMEKKDPDIWNLYGTFDGRGGDGWFANDPVDGALGVMSRTAEGAAGCLDPGTEEGKNRFDYLLGKGEGTRDWQVVNDTNWQGPGGNVEVDAGESSDTDNRKGLGDALTVAATGIDPSGAPHGPTAHTAANDRVFQEALSTLSGQGDDMPSAFRDDMAKIMTSHGDEVYAAMSDQSGKRSTLDEEEVMEMTKQISRSENSYGMLHEGMNHAIVAGFHDVDRAPEDTLSSAGTAVGFMEEARYNALKGDQHDYTWDKAWSYHGSGAILNFIPVYGDIAQRGADVVTTAWIMDEQKHQAEQLTSDNQLTYETRKNQLNALADQWRSANGEWADKHTGYSADEGVYNQIAAAANDGNDRADGIAGDQ
ncbi:hypothetical protein [Streptomyces sp. NPDC055134]